MEKNNHVVSDVFSYEDLKKYRRKIESKPELLKKELKRFNDMENFSSLSDEDQKKVIALLSKKENFAVSPALYAVLIYKIAQSKNETLKTKATPFAKKNNLTKLMA